METEMKVKYTDTIMKVAETMSACLGFLIEYVKSKGNFLDTHCGVYIVGGEERKTTLYGYALDDEEELSEFYIYGFRWKDGWLECYLVPKTKTYTLVCTKEEMMADEDNWYTFGGVDGNLYDYLTLVSVIDDITEY